MDKIRLNKVIKHLKNEKLEYFDEFYELTKSSVFYVLRNYTMDKELIADIMQDTYIKFLDNLANVNIKSNPLSYLLSIAKNRLLDVLKKENKLDKDIEIDMMTYEDGVSKYEFPLLIYSKKHLTIEEYRLLELTVIFGYKRVEVAKLYNKPISTINWQYNNIIKKVKKFYKEVYGEKDK